ncbi:MULTISPECIES: alkene reductase [unclassified Colwellia]|uniref:alkene reductase n=1 Tax=unclassified Colwellia TaxID=196834 RepID=UPI0015F73F5F|nr:MULTISPECIES: alkene reductase [unclassified Colwellia]MBA6355082.1 alkene reductase [Colwellia sp. BRX8-3]MBA6359758.1 alkene reductase [Colwellia sp. BRX8-6]MBA6366984.1 alkene reductase [Colwellia sp. BRX8-5]MBA6375449.1 alkene reductase [Colwellia sp. BRX8-2]
MTDNLFQPYALNDTITLNNRILMAPLTRCMADDNLVPTVAMAEYYGRRAEAGLIISEATIIRPDGQGNPNTPGLFTQEQVNAWKFVTKTVHDKGGKIFAQLWHTGRVAHPHFFEHNNNGSSDVLAPSAVGVEGTVPRMRDLNYQVPRAVTHQEIEQLIADFAQAAKNAIEAGFDGVEIHGANGYLIDQFLHYDSNRRTDEYGETPENMTRFPLAVVDAVIASIGKDRTALRISPGAYFFMSGDARDRQVFDHLLTELEQRDLAFLHLGIFDDSMVFDYLDGQASSYIRANYTKTLVGVGSYTPDTGSNAIADNKFDLVAIGRPFIANADYVAKVRAGEDLVEYNAEMLTSLI